MLIVFIRTAILYALVVAVMRIMGKRQIGELQPYEFVITIMISDLASLPMQDTRFPLLLGVIPIITLLFMKTMLSQIQLKSQYARKIVDGEPCILISKGRINYEVIKNQQIHIDELLEELRLAGYFDLDEIQYAILENNGQLSILPISSKDKSNSSSSSSQKNSGPYLPKILITDGQININSLTSMGKDKDWINNILKNHTIDSIDKVLIAMYDTKGKFKYQLYDKYEKECDK